MGRYLIDTNILIHFLSKALPPAGQKFVTRTVCEAFYISIISEMEILGHTSATEEIEEFIRLADILDLNRSIVIKTIEIRKQYKIKLPDAIIAATAITHKMILVTQNVRDFKNISGLEVINPMQPNFQS